MAVGGEGIGHAEGMTFFIKDALIGDRIRARVTKVKKNYGYARVEELLSPSPFRIEPPCPLHRRCGGCQIQALSYDQQLSYKEKKVRQNLMRIGGFPEEMLDRIMEPPVGMDEPFRYRNKAQFPIGRDREGRIITGFYAVHSHDIIPVEDCLLGVAENEPILRILRAWMEEFHIAPYEEESGEGLLRHVLIRYGFTSKELMVCLIINAETLPHQKELTDRLSEIAGMTSISINCNRKRTNVILGSQTICIWGKPYITDVIHFMQVKEDGSFVGTDTGISYHISPQSFYQVNPVQTERLYSMALAYADLHGEESVWDLYCGIGTISLFLAQKAGQVYGVEVVPQAIEDARNNAKLNNITNVEFFAGKAEEILPKYYDSEGTAPEETDNVEHMGDSRKMSHPDVIVVDPPRKGCDEKCIKTMLLMQPDRIVYVSCDPATLARDLRMLCEGGYELKRMRVFDQFPNSVHVETVVGLQRIDM